MSEKKFEPCTLEEATHVEVNGKMYEFGGNEVLLEPYHGEWIGIRWREEDVFIPVDAFPIFGIKTFKEIKPEPIEFEATFAKYLGNWIPLYTMHDGFLYEDNKKAKFKCIQILEEEK